MDKKDVLTKIKLKRVALGLSQDVVAKAIGLDDSHYSKLERGLYDISLAKFIDLMGVLKLGFGDFIDGHASLPHQEVNADSLKPLIDSMNANTDRLFKALFENNEKKHSTSTELLMEKLEALKGGDIIINNMLLILQRTPEVFLKQFSFDVDSLKEQVTSEFQQSISDRKPNHHGKRRHIKRQP